ncbi:MAG: PolC-type DNA polymerase III [Clostridia bacterium]|nr:PolC-type DNA polymerase III [Clostridia bacterium]
MSYDDLITTIINAAPGLSGKLTLDRVIYKRGSGHAYFYLLSDTVAGEKEYAAVQKVLRSAFPGVRLSLRIASPSLKDSFLSSPDKYGHVINNILLRQHPAVAAWEYDMRYKAENGTVVLELPDDFAYRYFKEQGLIEKINQAIKDIFCVEVNAICRVTGVREETNARIERERRAEEALNAQRRELALKHEEELRRRREAADEKKRRLIRGRQITEEAVAISTLNSDTGVTVIKGKRLDCEEKEISNGEMLLVTFHVTDYTGTMKCKMFLRYRPKMRKDEAEEAPPITDEQRAQVADTVKRLKDCDGVMVKGDCRYDNFAHECTMMVESIMRYDLPKRVDNAPEKRIELHMHTQMSSMDAVASATALISRAAQWGHPAIAVTDHGVVQSYPEAFGAAKKNGIKLIPGVEGYLTDEDCIVRSEKEDSRPLSTPIIVLDFETTGLDTRNDRIIEIGAVKLSDGHVIEDLSILVNPEQLLKPKITEITGITDQMLLNQPKITEALPRLLDFIGDCPIAAHNADFDYPILQSELHRQGITREYTVIDTLTFARKLYPDMKSHKLNMVCKRLGVSLKNAHRAVHDATATAHCLRQMLEEAGKRGASILGEINEKISGYTLGSSYHIVLLATSQKGLENINHLVSDGHLKYFRRRPHMPRANIQHYREGILLGSACEAGELFRAVLEGADEKRLSRIARFYDYLEIQPVGNNEFLIREGRVKDVEELREMNRTIVRLGEKLGIPVVATGDVHFLDPEDSVFRAILQDGLGYEDCDEQPPLYLKTTEEMLEEFSYLGTEKAHEVVIDNPHKILDRIGEIALFPKHPEGKTTFSPVWDYAPDDIREMVDKTSHEMYGDVLPEIVQKRLDKELKSIIGYGYATLYDIASKLVRKSNADGYLVGSRGSVGSSLVATMCGITEVNALPPHYRCKHCRQAWFDIPEGYTIGVDLPDKNCPNCGQPLTKDGFDIPFEVFLGFKGDKVPDIDLNFSGEYQGHAMAYVEELFGQGFVFRAGTIGTLAEKTAYGFVLKYLEKRNIMATEAEKNRLVAGCVGVKRTTGQHPGGMVVLPKAYDICQFTAVQHPADDDTSNIITTHYDFNSMHDILVKLDILGHDDPTMMHMLERITGVNYKEIPLDDKAVMSLFCSPEALGVTAEQINCTTGTLGIPEFGTAFVRGMLEDTKPSTMEELIRISGLSHGTDVWLGNAKDLIDSGTATLKECICTRDDIMNYLISKGVDSKISFDTMESVRKGRGLKPEMEEAMAAADVPHWFVDSCKKIKYMFPKGHAVAYVTMALRVAWFKVHMPLAYYAAYFTIRATGFDAATMIMPPERVRERIAELDQMEKPTAREKDAQTALEMVLEFLMRGFRFLPADLYKSDVKDFVMEDNCLRVPFTSIGGLGESAAAGIVEARSQPFISIEDLKNRAKVSTAVVELLRDAGALEGLKDTNQVSMLDMLGSFDSDNSSMLQ